MNIKREHNPRVRAPHERARSRRCGPSPARKWRTREGRAGRGGCWAARRRLAVSGVAKRGWSAQVRVGPLPAAPERLRWALPCRGAPGQGWWRGAAAGPGGRQGGFPEQGARAACAPAEARSGPGRAAAVTSRRQRFPRGSGPAGEAEPAAPLPPWGSGPARGRRSRSCRAEEPAGRQAGPEAA